MKGTSNKVPPDQREDAAAESVFAELLVNDIPKDPL
ncbi:hypothetical protein EDD64_12361 [Effusibacillus lacus]|nr:hypothetical protein EDD64_12361 [Effusibacillus lacus]